VQDSIVRSLSEFSGLSMSSRESDPPLEPTAPGAGEPPAEEGRGIRSSRFSALARALGGRIDGEDLTDWDVAVLRWIDARLSMIQATQGEAAAREAMDQIVEILHQGADDEDPSAA